MTNHKNTTLMRAIIIIIAGTMHACGNRARIGNTALTYLFHHSEESGSFLDSRQQIDVLRDYIKRYNIAPIPPAPPISDSLYEPGRMLAFDKILSGNRDISCMTCHHPNLGTTDRRHLPLGTGGRGLGIRRQGGPVISRNALPLYNLHTYKRMFWDSRVLADEYGLRTPADNHLTQEMSQTFDFGIVSAQAMLPVTSREEMRGEPTENELADVADDNFTLIWQRLMERLGKYDRYIELFERAYPRLSYDQMSFAHAANAIAAFEITAFESVRSPWERFVRGDDQALNRAQLSGAIDFFEAGCGSCHSGTALSDFQNHNIGMPQIGPGKSDGPSQSEDFGFARTSGNGRDRYAFRTPPLYNVALTAPYGHAGQYSRMEDMIRHFIDIRERLLTYNPREFVQDRSLWGTKAANEQQIIRTLSPEIDEIHLSVQDSERIVSIIIFLDALTDPWIVSVGDMIPRRVPSGLPVED
jgi:cytochrome c peroxidase